jgi:uncharacterized membrane-anchored protein YitT (DUF2179 family)
VTPQRIRRAGERVLKARPVRDYSLMTLGVIVAAVGFDAFLIPNRIAAGGISGLATIVYNVGLDYGVIIPVGVQMLFMNAILLMLAIGLRGWSFGLKTVYGAIGLSIAIDLLAPFVPHLAEGQELLAVVYGGAVAGIGIGLVFKAGGNTGGTDIIAQLVAPKIPLSIGQIVLAVDAVVILLAGIAFGPELAMWSFLAVFVMARVIDLVQEGVSLEKAAFIISKHPERMAEAILYELNRGATGLAGRGLYSGESREVIMTVVRRQEVGRLKDIVRAVDSEAFLIVTDVHEAVGEGFGELRASE